MDIIRPKDITDTTLTTSNVAENDAVEWNGTAVTYSVDDFVMVTVSNVHKVYQAVVAIAANAGNDSPEVDVLNPVPKWIETGSTNRWKMFSATGGDRTENALSVSVRITQAEVVNSIALLDLTGDSVDITMTDPIDGVVFSKHINLVSNGGIQDWYNYYFSEVERMYDVVITDLPAYGTAYIDITINSTTVAKCGLCIIGVKNFLGKSQYGATIGITDYSVKDVDDFGRSYVVNRSFVKRMDVDLLLDSSKTDSVHLLLSQLRTTPVVWIASELYSSTIIYGYFKDFDMVIASHPLSECNIEIEGLI